MRNLTVNNANTGECLCSVLVCLPNTELLPCISCNSINFNLHSRVSLTPYLSRSMRPGTGDGRFKASLHLMHIVLALTDERRSRDKQLRGLSVTASFASAYKCCLGQTGFYLVSSTESGQGVGSETIIDATVTDVTTFIQTAEASSSLNGSIVLNNIALTNVGTAVGTASGASVVCVLRTQSCTPFEYRFPSLQVARTLSTAGRKVTSTPTRMHLAPSSRAISVPFRSPRIYWPVMAGYSERHIPNMPLTRRASSSASGRKAQRATAALMTRQPSRPSSTTQVFLPCQGLCPPGNQADANCIAVCRMLYHLLRRGRVYCVFDDHDPGRHTSRRRGMDHDHGYRQQLREL